MTDIEDRLSDYFANTELSDPAPEALVSVRRSARRRTWRTRLITGACGLAAIAGLGSLVPTGSEPEALLTADQPVEANDTGGDEPAAVDEAVSAQEIDGAESTDERVPAARPAAQRIIADGDGGYVAIGVTTSAGRTSFVRSDNAEDWYEAGEFRYDDELYVHELRRVDGLFVAILDDRRPMPMGPGDQVHPEIAVSADLVSWRFVPLELNNDDEAWTYQVGDIAANGDDLILVVYQNGNIFQSLPAATYANSTCSLVTSSDAAALVLCDGETVTVDTDDPGPFHRPRPRLFVSQAGADFIEVEGLQDGWFVDVASTPGFMRITASNLPWVGVPVVGTPQALAPIDLSTTADGDPLPDSFPTLAGVELAGMQDVAEDDNGDRLAVVNADGRHVVARLGADGSVTAQGELPPPRNSFSYVDIEWVGDRWVALVADSPVSETVRNGWRAIGMIDQAALSLIAADDAGETINYWGNEPHPHVQWGFFGGTRYRRPSTAEVLVEFSGDETRQAYLAQTDQPELPPAEAFTSALSVDGWTLSGDPLRGPLRLTSPTGTATEYADGFAFTNGDISDGVEMDMRTGSASPIWMSRYHGPLGFYDDDGNVLVEFAVFDIQSDMVLPVLGDLVDWRRGAGFSEAAVPTVRLLESVDGGEWSVLSEQPTVMTQTPPRMVPGQGEVLVVVPGGSPVERVVFDE